jgi:aspartate kinase
MIVLKYGGTSVGSPERMKEVVNIIQSIPGDRIVVLSAMAGTTDKLVAIAGCLSRKEHDAADELIQNLEKNYLQVVDQLFSAQEYREKGKDLILTHFEYLKSFTRDMFTIYEEKAILAKGEQLSTALFNFYLQELNIDSILLPALNFMRIDKDGEPDAFYIKENLKRELKQYEDHHLFITQGYICRDAYGEIDNLKRGGSDYSATLIGVASSSQEIQIWTDIDGMHNNDPRYVQNTLPLASLSFDEAAELAYFGAKILHPSSVMPAKLAGIPVRLKNTMHPEDPGTLISSSIEGGVIKAIAAKDNITALRIRSGRMLLAYGFLRKVFEIFESYRTPIDMITTSEVSVSVTIDDTKSLGEISEELKKYGSVEVNENLSIISVVGEYIAESKGSASRIFDALENIPVRMISYGGSRNNISLLVNTSDKIKALNALHKNLFENA